MVRCRSASVRHTAAPDRTGCVQWCRSAKNVLIIAEIGNDLEFSAEGPDVGGQRFDLAALQLAALDAGNPGLCNAHGLCDIDLRDMLPSADLGKAMCAGCGNHPLSALLDLLLFCGRE